MKPVFHHLSRMNLTNILLGSTGVLLLVALLLSFGRMNSGRNDSPSEIEKLRREVKELELAESQLQRQGTPSPSLIFPTNSYGSSPIGGGSASQTAADAEETSRKLEELQAQIRDLTEANQPPPIIEEEVAEVTEEEVEPISNGDAERRQRLIRNAILQATVLEYSAEDWLAAIEPTSLANFNVGDELALRRNDGILCYFLVTKEASGAFIVTLKAGIADAPPEIVPGDELIIPPAFDGQLD